MSQPPDLVTVDPDACWGQPRFAGHRVPVAMVLSHLDAGESLADLQRDYDWLTAEHVTAARGYVKAMAEAADVPFEAPKAVIGAKPADLS